MDSTALTVQVCSIVATILGPIVGVIMANRFAEWQMNRTDTTNAVKLLLDHISEYLDAITSLSFLQARLNSEPDAPDHFVGEAMQSNQYERLCVLTRYIYQDITLLSVATKSRHKDKCIGLVNEIIQNAGGWRTLTQDTRDEYVDSMNRRYTLLSGLLREVAEQATTSIYTMESDSA